MRGRRRWLRIAAAVLILILGTAIWYAWQAFPIISGFGAKNMASAVYLQHRDPASVLKEELAFFPITLGRYTVNKSDSSVTGSVWGFATCKAIYRAGLGCTLVNDFTEDVIRKQHFNLPAKPLQNTDTISWPYGNKITDSTSPAVNRVLLQHAIDDAMHMLSKKQEPAYTRAVLVVYDGKIVAEKYAPGYDKNSVMIGWSMSKSLTAAVIGVLVKQGRLNPDAPAPVPEWKQTPKGKITLKQLLQQTSGLDYVEDYSQPGTANSMLFEKGDMAAFIASLPLKFRPGTVFNYSSGNANILSRIIRQTVGDSAYAAFPYQSLFHKINMYSLVLEPDASGTYIGSSYSYATARDFARFGLLYYNNGMWRGEQILPANWVKETIKPCAADKQKHYGYQFWLNGYCAGGSNKRLYPDVPVDMYFADGFGGQNTFIIPSKKLVVVRLGVNSIDENKFLKGILQAVN